MGLLHRVITDQNYSQKIPTKNTKPSLTTNYSNSGRLSLQTENIPSAKNIKEQQTKHTPNVKP